MTTQQQPRFPIGAAVEIYDQTTPFRCGRVKHIHVLRDCSGTPNYWVESRDGSCGLMVSERHLRQGDPD